MPTKADRINDAYEQMRVSGKTVIPDAPDNTMALSRLESMMEEYFGNNICVDYAFEDTPDSSTPHNMERKYWDAVSVLLARRLFSAFGKQIPPEFMGRINAAFSFLSSATASVRMVNPSNRMPIGRGNRKWNYNWRRYYPTIEQAPISCKTNKMFIDDVDNFVEHFDAYLKDSETIASYVLTADTGLTINSESLATPDVNYQVKAVGGGGEENETPYQIKIVATTSDDRVTTRIINFELTEA